MLILQACVASASVPSPTPSPFAVELHAHLFMDQGLWPLARGSFFESHRARSWKDRFASQADAASLEASGLALVVVTLYAAWPFRWSPRQGIRDQVASAERFVAENPRWVIARGAGEARRALEAGKRVFVLALEGASGILETEPDLDELIERLGIRIVTPIHLLDDGFGGAAFLPGWRALATGSPFTLARLLLADERPVRNPRGLSERGRWLVEALVQRRVWVDLSHLSDRAKEEALALLEGHRQPPLVTHAPPRAFIPAERAAPDWLLERIAARGGVFGLMPSEDYVGATEGDSRRCLCGAPCRGGIDGLAIQYNYLAERIGAEPISLGSDTNGGVRHLPRACGAGDSLDSDSGFHQLGQSAQVWAALRRAGANLPSDPRAQLDWFLRAWEKVSP